MSFDWMLFNSFMKLYYGHDIATVGIVSPPSAFYPASCVSDDLANFEALAKPICELMRSKGFTNVDAVWMVELRRRSGLAPGIRASRTASRSTKAFARSMSSRTTFLLQLRRCASCRQSSPSAVPEPPPLHHAGPSVPRLPSGGASSRSTRRVGGRVRFGRGRGDGVAERWLADIRHG